MVSLQYEAPGVLNKVLYGWLSPFIYSVHIFIYTIFKRKGSPFLYLLLTNSNPIPHTYFGTWHLFNCCNCVKALSLKYD